MYLFIFIALYADHRLCISLKVFFVLNVVQIAKVQFIKCIDINILQYIWEMLEKQKTKIYINIYI